MSKKEIIDLTLKLDLLMKKYKIIIDDYDFNKEKMDYKSLLKMEENLKDILQKIKVIKEKLNYLNEDEGDKND